MTIECQTEQGEWISCPLFFGTDLEEWILAIQLFFNKFQIPEVQHVNLASHHIGVPSACVTQYEDSDVVWSWSEFLESLRSEFGYGNEGTAIPDEYVAESVKGTVENVVELPNYVTSVEDSVFATQGMNPKEIFVSILAESSKETLELHLTRGTKFLSLNFNDCKTTHPVHQHYVYKSIIFLTVIPRYFQFVFDPGERILLQCSSRLVSRGVLHNMLSVVILNIPYVQADDFIWSSFHVFDKQSEHKYRSPAAEMCILYMIQTEMAEMHFFHSDKRESTSNFSILIRDKIRPPRSRILNFQYALPVKESVSSFHQRNIYCWSAYKYWWISNDPDKQNEFVFTLTTCSAHGQVITREFF